ncbi:uncharacterized protein LOC119838285 [Zerene cesonia]|uniref:uncharacterized protein LOC119838285 n=1 Tax=Zerene cesonia TaxID=33412 RepID=UPI0018E57AB0|nr:uncharacterized protein LOC119838285 [Zerene cesonia]
MTSREVELAGGAPWGFRMHGGCDQNQPLRISRVNPGRKASLGGIREGDVITSINGQSTKNMTNSEAHAMLRSAGPNLRLGLNEDKEMSPRRRSIGKATELKRPSHLLTDINSGKAILQAPVYATIRPASHNKSTAPPMRSLSSPPTSINTAPPLTVDEPPKIHPTNPFYTTLPSNYSSASRLPIPNGRSSFSLLDRNNSITRSKDTFETCDSKSPFSNYNPESNLHNPTYNLPVNGAPNTVELNSSKTYDTNGTQQNKSHDNSYLRNPFDTSQNSDCFDRYHKSNEQYNANSTNEADFSSREEVMKHSITEHKISEIEEVKTIKKVVLNGSSDEISDMSDIKTDLKLSPDTNGTKDTPKEHIITPIIESRNGVKKTEGDRQHLSSSVIYKPGADTFDSISLQETQSNDVVSSKPPVKSPSLSQVTSPTYKRKHDTFLRNSINLLNNLVDSC